MEKRTAETENDVVKTYEVGFLLTPLLPEAEVVESAEAIVGKVITKAKGVIKSNEAPKMITLAYPIRKTVEHKSNIFRQAYFGWYRFEGAPALAVTLAEALKKSSEVVRSLIIELPPAALKEVVRRPARTQTTVPEVQSDDKATESLPTKLDEAALDKQLDSFLVAKDSEHVSK